MRKVLSFVLVLALVLGSFSMAFGLTDIADSDNSEAITVANDLGIITGFPDGTFKPDQAVNRAEFAAMITRALGVPESALAGFTATSFKDTSGYTWAVKYLAFCESKGIMLGDGYGNAMPGRTISLNEAITMVLRAVGYTENSSVLVGIWPSNYVSLAQDLSLYDDVASMATVDRGNAAQVIYNALTVTKVQVAADGTTTFSPTGANMLTSGLGATKVAAAVITGDEATDISLMKYLGAYAETYTKDGDVVAVGDVKTVFLYVDEIVSGGFETSDDTKYYVSTGALAHAAVTPFNNGDAGVAAAYTVTAGQTIAAEVSNKTITKIWSNLTWTANDKFQYEDGMIDDDDFNGNDFPMLDGEINYDKFLLQGVASLEDIDEDNVVYVYNNPTTGDISKITVGTDTVTGKVTKTTATRYTVDGVAYKLSTGSTAPTLGDTGTAYLDYSGYIFFWDVDDAAAGNYAILTATDASFSFGTTTFAVKLFTADGEKITVDVDDSVAGLTTTAMTIADNAIVEYSLNSDGELNDISAATLIGGGLVGKTSSNGELIGTTPVASGVVVFVYDLSDDSYTIGSVADFDTTITIAVGAPTNAAVADTAGKIDAIWIHDDIMDTDAEYGVINSTASAVNADDDNVLYLSGWLGADEMGKYTDQATTNPGGWTVATTTSGLQKFTLDNDGVVTGLDMTVTATADVDAYVAGGATTVTAVDGKIISIGAAAYRIADGAVIYVWDETDEEWVVKTAVSSLKGMHVKLYQSDADDVTGFDYVLAWETTAQ